MTDDQMPEFVKLLATLSLSYNESLNEFTLERYWQTLKRFDLESVKNAFQALTTKNPDRGHLMPEPSDVLRYLEGSSQLKAMQAWGHVLKVIRSIGSYDSVIFDDPILHRVIDDMGGWISLCETTLRELNFLGQSFQKLYAAYALNPPLKYPKKLTGRFERSHTNADEISLLMIGDPEKAGQVYQLGVDANPQLRKTPLQIKSTAEHTLALPGSQTQSLPKIEDSED